jgi:predicted amidohydrolase YtcJ
MKRWNGVIAVSFAALLSCTSSTMDQGAIYTAERVVAGKDQLVSTGQAIFVTNGVVREIGPRSELLSRHRDARVIDAGDATIFPGLTDAHAHLYGLGLSLDLVRLVDTTSAADVVARVRERAQTTPAGEWVVGRGWDQNDWAVKEFPTAALLDAAVPDKPVFLRRVDGHAAWVNTAAMRAAGITAATLNPPGGRIIRDARGEPTGVFVDDAMDLLERVMPEVTPELRKRRVLASAREIARQGLTEIHDAGADAATITAVRELIDEKQFPIRVYSMLSDNDALLREWFARGPLMNYGGRLTVRSVKMYADGALGSRGAALLAPYSDEPANDGLMIATVDHLTYVAQRARSTGFQANTHAIGDRGNRNVIDAYERAGVSASDRFRIEHLQVVTPGDFPRLARLGIIASMQPTHATSDMYWAADRVGPDRVKGAYAWRTVLNAGGRLALGSDFPVEAVNPWFGIYAAVTRQDQKGWPAGGWYPDQKLTLAEAIRGFTADAAYAAFEQDSRGTIEVGKLADFTIVEGNPYAMNAADLYKVKVKSTVVNGDVVYDASLKSSK